MLIELTIENFAIIDRLQVSFATGLNVITGETGAGKSILIGALDFLLGGKVFKDMIRSGENSAMVEASFDLAEKLLESGNFNGMNPFRKMKSKDNEVVLIRRELSRSGKSRAFINDQSCTLQHLREIGKLLVDIMGQHEHQSLLDPANHLAYLDVLGNLTEKTQLFSKKYRIREEKEKRLIQLRAENERSEERRRLLEFQIEEIDRATLVVGEEEDLFTLGKGPVKNLTGVG